MPTRVCSQCALSQERLPSQLNVMLRSVRCDETSLAGRKRVLPALHRTYDLQHLRQHTVQVRNRVHTCSTTAALRRAGCAGGARECLSLL